MGYVNFPPNLKDLFDDLHTRLRKIETAQRFTAPNLTADPTNTRNGDLWLNTTSNALKMKDSAGATQTVLTGTPITYTPTITPQSGTITSYTATATYVTVGKLCSVHFSITITNAGTGTGFLYASLPFNANQAGVGAFRENAVVGTMGEAFVNAGTGSMALIFYNNATCIATNYSLIGTLTYITA